MVTKLNVLKLDINHSLTNKLNNISPNFPLVVFGIKLKTKSFEIFQDQMNLMYPPLRDSHLV